MIIFFFNSNSQKCLGAIKLTVVYSVFARCVSEFGAHVLALFAVKSRHVLECDPRDITAAPQFLINRRENLLFFLDPLLKLKHKHKRKINYMLIMCECRRVCMALRACVCVAGVSLC